MTTYVLVHGAWHSGDLWEEVVPILERGGNEVHAPTLAGNRPGDPKTTGLDAAIASLIDYVTTTELEDIVLLGHSYGGMVITGATDRLPGGTVRRLVYLSAYVPRDGQSLVDISPPGIAEFFNDIRQPSGGLALPWEFWRDGFMNDTDEATARKYFQRLNDQPHRAMLDKIALRTDPAQLPCGKSYIFVEDDLTYPAEAGGWHPGFSERLGTCRLVTMPGGHEVCLTNPSLLADKVVEAAMD